MERSLAPAGGASAPHATGPLAGLGPACMLRCMARPRSVIASGAAAFVLLALAVMLDSFSLGSNATSWTPSPTKEVFDWVAASAPGYHRLAAAVIADSGSVVAVAAGRGYRAS